LLKGVALARAQSWLAKREENLPEPEREFIAQSIALWDACVTGGG